MTTVLYIAPGFGDDPGQARIYRATFDGRPPLSIRDHYAAAPSAWTEVGLMNYRGQLVCFDGPQAQRQELLDSQPLAAGACFHYPT